jgi:hypothetical protein
MDLRQNEVKVTSLAIDLRLIVIHELLIPVFKTPAIFSCHIYFKYYPDSFKNEEGRQSMRTQKHKTLCNFRAENEFKDNVPNMAKENEGQECEKTFQILHS